MCFGIGENVIATVSDFPNVSAWEVGFLPGLDRPVQDWFHSVCNDARDDFVEGGK